MMGFDGEAYVVLVDYNSDFFKNRQIGEFVG